MSVSLPTQRPNWYLSETVKQTVYQTSCHRKTQNLTLRLLMSYIYGAPTLDVSRSHTTTQHSR
jgi:hypothetical protein